MCQLHPHLELSLTATKRSRGVRVRLVFKNNGKDGIHQEYRVTQIQCVQHEQTTLSIQIKAMDTTETNHLVVHKICGHVQ